MLTVDYTVSSGWACGQATGCSTWGGGPGATPSRRSAGAPATAFDYDEAELKDVAALATAMGRGRRPARRRPLRRARGDATRLPFPDRSFDRIIAAEVLEHVDDDMGAIRELVRVLRPGGTIAATVPSFLPERICWALTDEYHAPFVAGGHVRIYTQAELRNKLGAAGAEPYARHKEHGIHAPTGG